MFGGISRRLALLNLEAPLVALGWQGLFARLEGVELRAVDRATLFGAVWIVYYLDHWLDGRSPGYPTLALRHRFQTKYSPCFAALSLALCVVLGIWAWLAFDRGVWIGAVGLGLATGLHLLAAQGRDIFGVSRPWKEARVGLIFALGCYLIPSVEAGTSLLNGLSLGFGALCLANCRLIELWEWEEVGNRLSHWNRGLALLAVFFGALALLRIEESSF